jgi:hypothetical protein
MRRNLTYEEVEGRWSGVRILRQAYRKKMHKMRRELGERERERERWGERERDGVR